MALDIPGNGLAEHYDRHRERLLRAAMRLLGDRASAEDAVQEAWVRALRHYGPGGAAHGDSPPAAWLYRVTVNICYDHLRSGQRRRTTPLVAPEEDEDPREASAEAELSAPDADPAEAALLAEQALAVREAVNALPPALREVVVLREYGGFKYGEIAEITGCPIGTVMSRLYVARRRLREKLAHLLETEG